jgi:hypothetical protein
VRLELTREGEHLVERVFGQQDGWQLMLASLPAAGDPDLDCVPRGETVRVLHANATTATLRVSGAEGPRQFTVDIELRTGERCLHYRVTERLATPVRSRSLVSRYAFGTHAVDFCWVPHLRPGTEHVVGQFAFKAPATIMQRGAALAALIADVDLIDADAAQQVCFEPDASGYDGGPVMSYGFKDHQPEGLIYFRHRPEMVVALPAGERSYGYRLYVNAGAEPHYGYREVVRLLWRLYGRRNFEAVIPQVIPMDRYANHALGYAIPTLWRDLPRDGVDCGGMIMGIKFPNDIWFHFFFNHLHTAFGLHRMGERRGQPELIDKARKIRNLVLSAPVDRGAFPAILSHQIINGIRHDRWIPHAHWVGGSIPYQTQIAPPPDQPAYSSMDLAWTSLWMLRWHFEIEAVPEFLRRAIDCGDLLLSVQLPSGSVPVWLHKDTLEPLELLRESPSAAAAGLLFAKLFEATHEARFLRGAERVAAFMAPLCGPRGWTDYESYFDSAGKPIDLVDHYTQQRPQNTFPMYWSAELAKTLFRITGDPHYREQALRAVDFLFLFQAVWSPPYLTVKGFGSIGIGNGHTGWNDARAGIFAPGIANFFELTGDVEYLQRAVAAMRAPLALMYIPENEPVSSVWDKGPLGYADECYAHRGRDARLGPSTFDFSVGYALMAYEELQPKYGQVYVDLAAAHGVGIDGCSVEHAVCDGAEVRLTIRDSVAASRPLTIALAQPAATALVLRVNDAPARAVPAGAKRSCP